MVYKVFVFRLVVAVYIVEQVVKAVASAVDARAKVTACGQGEAVNAQERTDSRCEEEEDEAGRQQRRSPPDRCSVAREQPEVLRHAGRAAAGRAQSNRLTHSGLAALLQNDQEQPACAACDEE